MTIVPQEIIRSEIEGNLSATTPVISDSSLDCGCKQFPCPKLAKYATRKNFLTIMCLIGVFQAAAYVYLHVTSSTISRRFRIDPYAMDWLLTVSEVTPFIAAWGVAYWGDRIHRLAWTGGLGLLQAASYLMLLIPQFTHNIRVIEETTNVTHMSIYADDSSELCGRETARIMEDEPCYTVIFILCVVQILSSMANVAYYALGISYLDDNTKGRQVAAFIGLVLSMKFIGVVFGYVLAWSFLKIDAESFTLVESYREQFGAWWLGWPILTILLAMPASLLAIFPRRLLSEVVEQAAVTILNESGTIQISRDKIIKNVGSTSFLPSLARLVTNKILAFNILAAGFCTAALYNFAANENLFLESRFYAPRPNGKFVGFSDPLVSRVTTNFLKPIMLGLITILSGRIIARTTPNGRTIAAYNAGVIVLAGVIIFILAYDTCEKLPIAEDRFNTVNLVKYCNIHCHCSRDADFRPVCDTSGKFTFYSACHAGCTSVDNTQTVRFYDGCSCIKEITGIESLKAVEGPCGSVNCQVGWITTIVTYSLVASSIVGDLLINLRSLYVQDKAIAIGFWLMWTGLFTSIPGKLIYQKISDITCKHWGLEGHICHLHDPENIGKYLCFVTAGFLAVSAIFKIIVYFFCKDLDIYNSNNTEGRQLESELQEGRQTQTEPLLNVHCKSTDNNANNIHLEVVIEPVPDSIEDSQIDQTGKHKNVENFNQTTSTISTHDPTNADNHTTESVTETLRLNSIYESVPKTVCIVNELDTSSDESNVFEKATTCKIAYRPLELDSDVENDLRASGPKSRKRVMSKDYGDLSLVSCTDREFPNPSNYEDPRLIRSNRATFVANSDTPNISNNSKHHKLSVRNKSVGDFNEIGIPIVESYEENLQSSRISINRLNDMITFAVQYERTASQDRLEIVKSLMDITEEQNIPSGSKKMVDATSARFTRPSSRGQSSSGFGSYPDVSEHAVSLSLGEVAPHSRGSLSSRTSASTTGSQVKRGPLTTDL